MSNSSYHWGETSNKCSGSTTWAWRKVKINPHPQGSQRGVAAPPKRRSRRARDAHRELWIKVQFRGGAEASWLVTSRGAVRRFPGYISIDEVGLWANGR